MSNAYKLPVPEDFAVSSDWIDSKSGRELLARAYAHKSKSLASGFEKTTTDWRSEFELTNAAGGLLIEVVGKGFLQTVPHLAERVAWHTADNSNDPVPGKGGVQAVLCRSPVNLFNEVVGGNMVIVQSQANGTIEVVDPIPLDGILPHLSPAVFANQVPYPVDGDPAEVARYKFALASRQAEICRYLADVILAEAVPTTSEEPDGDIQDNNSTFTPLQLRKEIGIGERTLPKYAKLAGVPTPDRGRRNHRYTAEHRERILKAIIEANRDAKLVEKCRLLLSRNRN